MIDVDKFICSYLSILEKCKEHKKGIEGLKISGRYQLIIDLLKQQGIIYKDGSLIKIGSKKCEGKLKEMLHKKVLANSCESCKDSPEPFRIVKEKWYMCIQTCATNIASVKWWKDYLYYAVEDGKLKGQSSVYEVPDSQLKCFRPATEEEIKGKVGNSDIPQRMESAKAKEEGYQKPEVDVNKMEDEWRRKQRFYSASESFAYRQGILDTLEKLKKG